MTLREYILRWQEAYDKPQSRPTTYAAHGYIFKNHILPGLGEIPLSELTVEQVGDFLEERRRFGGHRPESPEYQDSNIVWLDNDENKVLNKYLFYYYQLQPWAVSTGGTIARLYNDNISKAKIAVPPIEEQRRIVSMLDRFDTLCNDLTSGLPAEIEARKKQYEYYRDKLLSFKELK